MNILITGANRGLGLSLVKVGLEKGHAIVAGVRDINEKKIEQLTELKGQYESQLNIVPLDVTDEESVRAAANEVNEGLDVIINNAGILNEREKAIEDLDIEACKLAFDINTLGPIRVIKHFLPLLRNGDNQSIINISSDSGSLANTGSGDYPYGLSKAALNMLSEKLNVTLKDQDIQVLSIHPGWMKTDMSENRGPKNPDESAKDIYKLIERKIVVDSKHVYIDHQGNPIKL